jgi:hypothetical protein
MIVAVKESQATNAGHHHQLHHAPGLASHLQQQSRLNKAVNTINRTAHLGKLLK